MVKVTKNNNEKNLNKMSVFLFQVESVIKFDTPWLKLFLTWNLLFPNLLFFAVACLFFLVVYGSHSSFERVANLLPSANRGPSSPGWVTARFECDRLGFASVKPRSVCSNLMKVIAKVLNQIKVEIKKEKTKYFFSLMLSCSILTAADRVGK